MFDRTTMALAALSLTACAGWAHSAGAAPDGIAGPEGLFQRTIAREMMRMLPREQQLELHQAGAMGAEHQHFVGVGVLDLDERYEKIADWVRPEHYGRIAEGHLNMLAAMSDSLAAGQRLPGLCFSPGTPWETIEAFDLSWKAQQLRFQQTGRWNGTALTPASSAQGQPVTITYSFPPDGTNIPNLGIGLGSGPNALNAWLNGIYGSPAVWQALFAQVFDSWNEVSGITYVYEPNDDGVTMNNNPGIAGVRGDVRIGAFDFQNDGNGGVLAYNNFPNDGDMVFDAFDTFYNNVNGQSIRFRNVTAHEAGHGLGMLHVCPANQTKLMEPFISTAYDGPQIDDLLNAQRHYGDPNEPNDTTGQATPLGNVVIGTLTGTNGFVSIDDNADTDYYSINVLQPLRITYTVSPQGGTYQQGPQTQACNTGTTTNYTAVHDLQLQLIDTNGTTVLATENSTGTGSPETLVYDIPSAGTYYLRVLGDSTNNIQAYTSLLSASAPPFIGPSIALPGGAPTELDPGVATVFDVTVQANQDVLIGTPQLFYRFDGGAFQSVALSPQGGTLYEATLPGADCGDTPEFYIRATGQTVGDVFSPALGAAGPFTALVGEIITTFSDNFQTNLGWTVTGNITTQGAGLWQRGVPAGDGSRGDPPADADGSGQCYVTGNGGPGSNTDVDDGETILNSPVLDLSSNPEAEVSYWRWYDNTGSGIGANPGVETFLVEVSNNGGASWTTIEEVGPSTPESSGGWFFKTFRVADFVTPTSTTRFRFVAKDFIGAVIEAGVDGFSVTGLTCEQPPSCACDLDGNGSLTLDDLDAFAAAFNSSDLTADCDGNGLLTLDDLDCFITCFSAGCP